MVEAWSRGGGTCGGRGRGLAEVPARGEEDDDEEDDDLGDVDGLFSHGGGEPGGVCSVRVVEVRRCSEV